MKTWMRRPALLLVVAFLVVAFVAGFPFAKSGMSQVHAATVTPTISVSPHTVRPRQKITITGQGFAPNDTVFVFLDQLYYPLGNLTCNGNGDCSGSVTIPLTGPQGQHMVLAQGSQPGEAVVNAPIILNPTIFFNTSQGQPNQGGPGTSTAITGYAFQLNETVSVYWGDATGTLLGTVTSDSYSGFFTFPFITPTHVAPGKYPITVVRSGQKPASVTTTFTVVPPTVTAAAGIRSGQLLKFQIKGFQGNENVTISWNANGGQQIGVIQANYYGFFASPSYGQVFIPSAPLGSYTLTFTGESSGLQVSAPLNVGPGIQVNALNNPGGTIPVSGGGFRAGETLNVFIVDQKNATSISVTTAADGSFQTNLVVPLSLIPGPQYHVEAINSDGSEKATAFFYILAPSISWASSDIYNQNNTAAYGSSGTISGQNFPANEQITLYWNYQQAGQVEVGTVLAAADGSFSFDLTTPSSPFTGNATIEAIASTSTFTASYQVQPQPTVSLNPTSVLVGNTVSISGGSFDGNATVSIQLAGSTSVVGTATVASDGTFTASLTIPSNIKGGPSSVSVSDGTVSSSVPLVVDVPLIITPTTGSAGTSISVQSPNFSNTGNNLLCVTERPYIAWYDPTAGTSQYLASACWFPGTVTAPANLVSGRTYEVELIMGGYVIGQAPFTAQ
ncbi:hypothetical protein [Ktedonobacter racemifer]|uniref:IPT/TIG domain-containing protein n=1 Tax=Ktedonobacter racemifer DSM 44963 TaxID=485913 RepID=D6U208_KTERA|nr:hypothetical protein [Ktedonobacter racemifer]EFH80892.1 hypothetical protein Krac_1525 [Ktedonobacter racemifer DSM 44963]